MDDKEIYIHQIQELNELLNRIAANDNYKDLEFRLFKRCVRKFVNKKQYKNICDLYNQAVSKFREGKSYFEVKVFIDSK